MDFILLLLIFLPNFALFGINLPTDNQIFFLIPYLLLVLNRKINLTKIPFFIFIPFFLMIIGFTYGNLFIDNYHFSLYFNARSIFSYFLITIIFGIGIYYSKNPRIVFKVLKITFLILFFAIVIEKINPSILDSLIARNINPTAISKRGFRSLFSEPSFVPSYMLLYSFIYLFLNENVLNSDKKFSNYIFVGLALILAISSASGQIIICAIIILLSILIAYIFLLSKNLLRIIIYRKLKISRLFISSSIIMTSIFSLVALSKNFYLVNNRVFYFLNLIMNNNFIKILSDQSLTWRLHAIYMPFATPFISPFNIIPNKSAYIILSRANKYSLETFNTIYSQYSEWFNNLTGLGFNEIILPTKTYSILGNLSYDFALLGLIFAIFLLYIISKSLIKIIENKNNPSNYDDLQKIIFCTFIILFSFINLSILCPPYWFSLGLIYGLSKNITRKRFIQHNSYEQ